jgi:Ca2+/Na+ antiporter
MSQAATACTWTLFQDDMCLSLIDGSAWGVVFEIVLFLLAFAGLAFASEHLCNSMETLCDHWSIQEDVGGATFIALGGAIPEITINCISTFKSAFGSGSNSGVGDVGVGAILGSGMIAYLLIPSLSCLVSPNGTLFVKQTALFRDCGFYSVAVILLITAVFWGVHGIAHGFLLVSLYAIYVTVVVFGDHMHFWWSRTMGHPHLRPVSAHGSPSVFRDRYSVSIGKENSAVVPLLSMSFVPELFDGSDDLPELITEGAMEETAPSTKGSYVTKTLSMILSPLESLINISCPDCRIFQKHENLYMLTFITSFSYITFFSFVITIIVGRWVGLMNVPAASAAFGVILVAVGAEIPDTVNATTIARRGFGGMATSACLGSQVVNICLGLGMPWLVTAALGKTVLIGAQSDVSFIHIAALVVLIDVIMAVGVVSAGGRTFDGKLELDRSKSFVLMTWYVISVGALGVYSIS